MSSYRRLTVFAAALAIAFAILAPAALAAYWPALSADDAKKIMPVSEVKRGMRGYGLTVFQGTTIEKFDVEVLGVMKRTNTGRDLIMVRVGGGPINKRQTGIMSGMSGSPVYIKGKLVGAIAYGMTFAKEPVGMVTPIGDMLEAWDSNLPKHPSGYSSAQSLPEPMSVDGKTVTKVKIDDTGSSRSVEGDTMYMQPLMTPLMCTGISKRGLQRLAEILRPYNIKPMAGPGGSDPKSKVKVDLQAGSAIGMSLASGDIDMTGIGTVTYRRGNRLVAFGHPMLGIGSIDAPMTTAYIVDCMSNFLTSVKVGTAIQTVGRIFQDRPWSIAGALGAKAKTIPVTIAVDDQSAKRDRVFRVNVINHPLLAARLISMVTGEAIATIHTTPGDATALVSYDVVADQIGKISRSNVFFDPASIDMPAVMDVAQLLTLLSTNKFEPLDIRSVSVKVKILPKRETAVIDRIFVKKGEFEPGEVVDVGVVMRPYKQPRVTKTFQIKIPATAADGKIGLIVRGGGTPAGLQMMTSASAEMSADSPEADMMPGGSLLGGDPGMANADNVQQLISKFLEREKNNEVVLQLQMRNTAINVAGEKLGGMPSAIADVMRSSRNSGLKMEREEVKAVFANDSLVSGVARLTLDVKRKSLRESKAPLKLGSSIDLMESGSDSSLSSSSSDATSMDTGDYSDIEFMRPRSGSGPEELQAPPAPAKEEPVKEEPMSVDKDSADPADPDLAADETPDTAADQDKPTASTGPKSNVKTVVRQATMWTQKTQADFAKGRFIGVSASSENKLELAPTLKKLSDTPEQYAWSVCATTDGVYAGTGNSGRIYKITDAGESSVFYETGELEVHSVVRDSAGNVYAATSPHGKIFKIAPDGKGRLLHKADEKYVLALALDPEGNLYAGVGDAGKVYKVTPEGAATVFAQLNEQQVLSLAWDPHGSLLIGTGINGVVYRADKAGRVKPIFDAPEDAVTSVVSDGDSNAYVGTKSAIYRVDEEGRSKNLYPKASRVMSMVCDSQNNVYAVSDSTLVKISPDDTVVQLDSSQEKLQFLSLALNEAENELYASTGNVGAVYLSKCCDIRGTFESPVHDAKMPSKWGRIKWIADTPEGTSVEVRTRTGNVENPDSTWTDWSAAYPASGGQQVTSAPGRYVQYQVVLGASKLNVTPRVSLVSISYLTPNQAPVVKLSSPTGGETWASKQTIRWTGSDPDKDTLSYDVFYSKNGGKDWTALVGGMSGGAAAERKPAGDIMAKLGSELAKSKDVPEDVKKPITAAITAAGKADAPPTPKPAGSSSSSTSYNWDTSSLEDGTYVVKVVVSDKSSNAADPLTDSIVSEPFTVCNKAPELKLGKRTIQMKAATAATITGTAISKSVEITGVQYRVDGGGWAAAAPDSGMFDSPTEDFTITTANLSLGSHKVEVQAIDAAGNATSQTVDVKVS